MASNHLEQSPTRGSCATRQPGGPWLDELLRSVLPVQVRPSPSSSRRGPCRVGAAEDTPAYTSLSGTWTGSYSILQRGRCTWGRSPRRDAQVRLILTVDPEGASRRR